MIIAKPMAPPRDTNQPVGGTWPARGRQSTPLKIFGATRPVDRTFAALHRGVALPNAQLCQRPPEPCPLYPRSCWTLGAGRGDEVSRATTRSPESSTGSMPTPRPGVRDQRRQPRDLLIQGQLRQLSESSHDSVATDAAVTTATATAIHDSWATMSATENRVQPGPSPKPDSLRSVRAGAVWTGLPAR